MQEKQFTFKFINIFNEFEAVGVRMRAWLTLHSGIRILLQEFQGLEYYIASINHFGV